MWEECCAHATSSNLSSFINGSDIETVSSASEILGDTLSIAQWLRHYATSWKVAGSGHTGPCGLLSL
jgi:hypothetical protein